MNKEFITANIFPLFAKACAESLKDPVNNMLHQERSRDELMGYADAAGKLYAAAYTHLFESFVSPSRDPACSQSSSANQPAAVDSTQEAEPQESEASLYRLLQQSLKIQKLILERIHQQSAH